MARLIKCPSCGTQMDVGGAQPGTIVGCPGCQVKIRIPTGQTSARIPAVGGPSVGAPTPAPGPAAAPSRSGSGTRRRGGSGVRRRGGSSARGRKGGGRGARAGRRGAPRRGGDDEDYDEEGYGPPEKKSNTGLIVGIIVGVVVIVVVIIAIVVSSDDGGQQGPYQAKRRRSRGPSGPMPVQVPVTPVAPVTNPMVGMGGAGGAAKAKPKGTGIWNPKRWGECIDQLKLYGSAGYGGDFYEYIDPNSKRAFDQVKMLGEKSYPYLVAFITDPDPQRGRGAVVALKQLNGDPRKGKSPGRLNPGNSSGYAQEWIDILGIDSSSVDSAKAELGIGAGGGGE